MNFLRCKFLSGKNSVVHLGISPSFLGNNSLFLRVFSFHFMQILFFYVNFKEGRGMSRTVSVFSIDF
jgi:hypothetical protein